MMKQNWCLVKATTILSVSSCQIFIKSHTHSLTHSTLSSASAVRFFFLHFKRDDENIWHPCSPLNIPVFVGFSASGPNDSLFQPSCLFSFLKPFAQIHDCNDAQLKLKYSISRTLWNLHILHCVVSILKLQKFLRTMLTRLDKYVRVPICSTLISSRVHSKKPSRRWL